MVLHPENFVLENDMLRNDSLKVHEFKYINEKLNARTGNVNMEVVKKQIDEQCSGTVQMYKYMACACNR